MHSQTVYTATKKMHGHCRKWHPNTWTFLLLWIDVLQSFALSPLAEGSECEYRQRNCLWRKHTKLNMKNLEEVRLTRTKRLQTQMFECRSSKRTYTIMTRTSAKKLLQNLYVRRRGHEIISMQQVSGWCFLSLTQTGSQRDCQKGSWQ